MGATAEVHSTVGAQRPRGSTVGLPEAHRPTAALPWIDVRPPQRKMKALIYRVAGPPPGQGARQIDQLRWVRRLLLWGATPAMALAIVVLVVVGHVYIVAAIFAVAQLLSIGSTSLRIRRDERRQQD